jgi:hypothetical protein
VSLDREIIMLLLQRLHAKGILDDEDIQSMARNVSLGKDGWDIASLAADHGWDERELTVTSLLGVISSTEILKNPPPDLEVAYRRKQIRLRTAHIERKKDGPPDPP